MTALQGITVYLIRCEISDDICRLFFFVFFFCFFFIAWKEVYNEKVERLNVNSVDPDETPYAVCKKKG